MTARPSIRSRMLGSNLRRHTATLLSGSGIALVVSLGLQPVLARLYAPEAFGVADAFVSIVALVLPFASLKYEDAIMIPEDRDEAATILGLAFSIAVAVCLVLTLFLPFREAIGAAVGSSELGHWLWLAPLAVLLYRTSELVELWTARAKRFRAASSATAVRSITTGAVRVAMGTPAPVHVSPLGLIAGFMSGYAAALVVLLFGRMGRVVRLLRSRSAKTMQTAALRFREFPLFSMPSALLSSGAGRLPFLLLLFYFDESTVGLFGRAFTAVMVPLTLVGSAVSRSFFVHAAESNRQQTLDHISSRVHDRMVMIAMLPVVMILIAGPPLFGVVFGQDWTAAGDYARAAVPWFALAGITSPLTRIFDVSERQRADFIASLFSFVAVTGGFLIGCLYGNPTRAILVGSSAAALSRMIQLALLLRIAGVPLAESVMPYVRYTTYALPLAALLAAGIASDSGLILLICSLFGTAVYGLLCLRKLTS